MTVHVLFPGKTTQSVDSTALTRFDGGPGDGQPGSCYSACRRRPGGHVSDIHGGERPTAGLWRLPSDRVRRSAQAVVDPLVAMGAVLGALWLRYETEVPPEVEGALPWMLLLVGVAQLVAGWSQGLYMGRWRFGGFEEVVALARSVTLSSLLLFLVNVSLSPRPVPLSACVAQGVFTVVACSGVRWTWRVVYERALRPTGDDLVRVVVVGAGDAGGQLVGSMVRNPGGRLPAGRLRSTTIPSKRNLRLHGVPVMGTATDVCAIAARVDARTVVLPIPSADGHADPRPGRLAAACGLEVLVLPPVHELLGQSVERRRRPAAHRGRPARPPPDRHRPRLHRRLRHRSAGPGHRGRRLDRLGAVPPAEPLRTGRAGDARPRRVGPPRRPALAGRPGPARRPQPGRGRHPRPRAAGGGVRRAPAPRWCSTPPPSSTSRCSRCTRPRR